MLDGELEDDGGAVDGGGGYIMVNSEYSVGFSGDG